jgi:hypothetical protein
MFETLDIMISLAVMFLILSMVHKYLVSLIKRALSIKAKVVADEMKTLKTLLFAQLFPRYHFSG